MSLCSPSSSASGSSCAGSHLSGLSHHEGGFGSRLLMPLDENEALLSLKIALKAADVGHLCEDLPVHMKWCAIRGASFLDGHGCMGFCNRLGRCCNRLGS